MKNRYYPAALALLMLAAPALASPMEDAECLISHLSAGDISIMVAEVQTGASERTIAYLRRPVEVCSEGQVWTPDRRGNAAGYAIAVLTRGTLGGRLSAQGVDAAALDSWFARQTLEFRTTAFMGMNRADLEATLMTLIGNEVTIESMARHGQVIGAYLGALMAIERIDRGLGM